MKRKFRNIIVCLMVISTFYFWSFIFLGSGITSQSKLVSSTSKDLHRQTFRRIYNISCRAILDNDRKEIDKAKVFMVSNAFKPDIITDREYLEMTRQCERFRELRGYISYEHVTQEELEFPIAYSILLYKDVSQAERLLRAIYRPHNIYCLHVDADSKTDVHAAIQAIANCFPNVFVVSRKEFIVYAGFSRLQADLNCMTDLLQSRVTWKYFINLPSQQFPIKTNAEIVKILRVYNGSNDIEGITGPHGLIRHRIQYHHFYKYSNIKAKAKLVKSNGQKEDPPFNISIVKGSAYGVFSKDMVRYICENKISRALLDYLRDVNSPDEYYWATLNHNPHIGAPGSYKGNPDKKPWLASYSSWVSRDECHGKSARGVCIFGVEDLNSLIRKNHLFVNKFYQDYQPLALQCMEEWYFNKTLSESWPKLNLAFYKALPFINR